MKRKQPSAVELAQAFAAQKNSEVKAAREALRALEAEVMVAYVAVRKAQEAEDAHLPQCRIVTVMSGGRVSEFGPVVILRKTNAGLLVTRRVGGPGASAFKFKWHEHSGKFRQAEKQSPYAYAHRELRDVPAEYMPATGAQP